MSEYLLDTNVVIGLWEQHNSTIDKLIEDKKIKITEEVVQELVVKERREYKRQQVLSERFCKLLSFIIEVDKTQIDEFYSMLNIKYSKKGNAYFNHTNKLSRNDLFLLYCCYLNNNFILVTEDKYLFNAANSVLGKDRVLTLKLLVESVTILNNDIC